MEPSAGLAQLFKATCLCSWPGLQPAFAFLLDLIAPWQLEVGRVGKTSFPLGQLSSAPLLAVWFFHPSGDLRVEQARSG